jgi:putative hydrolase of the HAD superfamily
MPAPRNGAVDAVVFDVDFTLVRPGPALDPSGYVELGRRYGLELDAALYEAARDAALVDLSLPHDHRHDDEVWIAFTERIVVGMGGDPGTARACAEAMTLAWEDAENFLLYEDAVPTLARLRERGLKLGLVTNSGRDLEAFVVHHGLDVDAGVVSREHGFSKPSASIFAAILELLDVEPAAAAMVGDSPRDDIEGARAVGMRGILVDRDDRHPDYPGRLRDLSGLVAALGL